MTSLAIAAKFLRRDPSFEGTLHSHEHVSRETEMKTCFDNKTVSEQLKEDEDYGYKHWM